MNNLCIHSKLFLMVNTCCDIPKICCKILTADAVFSSKCEELTSKTKVYRKAKIAERTVYNPISKCRHGTFSKEHMVHIHVKHTRWCGINSLDWTDYWDRSLLTLLCYDAIRNILLRIGHLLNLKSDIHCTYTHTHKYTGISLTSQ